MSFPAGSRPACGRFPALPSYTTKERTMFGVGSMILIGAWPARVEIVTAGRYFARYVGRHGGVWYSI